MFRPLISLSFSAQGYRRLTAVRSVLYDKASVVWVPPTVLAAARRAPPVSLLLPVFR